MPTLTVSSAGAFSIPYAVSRLTTITAEAKLLYGVISAVLSSEDPTCDEKEIAADLGIPVESVLFLFDELSRAGLLNVNDDGKGTARVSLAKHPCFKGIEVNEE